MKISYAITVCNEHKEIEKLLSFLFEHKREQDQVIVQMDSNATEEVINICERFENRPLNEYKLNQFSLNKNFAEFKNNLNKQCDGDWIFQIDADELPNEYLIEALPFILEANEDTEAFWAKWGWKMNEDGWVNFPDWQMRIYQNKENIYWIKPVHEQLRGYTKFGNLPAEENYALYHPKNIGRQEKQNEFYNTI